MTISHINNDKTINDEHILAIYKNGYIIFSYLHIGAWCTECMKIKGLSLIAVKIGYFKIAICLHCNKNVIHTIKLRWLKSTRYHRFFLA